MLRPIRQPCERNLWVKHTIVLWFYPWEMEGDEDCACFIYGETVDAQLFGSGAWEG